jgi:hypothetical protein
MMNVVNKKVLGARAKKKENRLGIIPVLEKDQKGRFHYHLTIGFPDNINKIQLEEIFLKAWRLSYFGYDHAKAVANPDQGWLKYILKSKGFAPLADRIDWENFNFRN